MSARFFVCPHGLAVVFSKVARFRHCSPEGRSVALFSPRTRSGGYCPSEGRSVPLLSPRRPIGFAIFLSKAARFRYCLPEGCSVSLLSARRLLGRPRSHFALVNSNFTSGHRIRSLVSRPFAASLLFSLLPPRRPLCSDIVPLKAARFRYCPPEGRSVSLLFA